MSSDGMPSFEGMTLYERLASAGKLEAWDAAVAARDKREVVRLLAMLAVSDPDTVAADILDAPEAAGP
jgi:hypothetical protein